MLKEKLKKIDEDVENSRERVIEKERGEKDILRNKGKKQRRRK